MNSRRMMANTTWLKQTKDNPLFPDLLWSRPENKRHAGKLLIIGGNAHGFAQAAQAYSEALKAGIGVAKVLLPDALKKIVGEMFETAEFAPSTPSGSFNQKSLDRMLDLAAWADGVLVCGELGRNAETAAVLEKFAAKYSGQLSITRDAVDIFNSSPAAVLSRQKTTLTLSLAQLQRLASEVNYQQAVTYSMGLPQFAKWLNEFSEKYSASLITWHLQNTFVACGGKVSSTKTDNNDDIWRLPAAAHASVWWLQNPNKTFEAITSSIIA